MNVEHSENTPEQKIEQVQSENNTQELSPDIKSEDNQANWKKFREQRELERKAKEEAEKRAIQKQEEAEALRAALEAITNKPSNNSQYDNSSDDIEESEEARIDKRVEVILKQREEQRIIQLQKEEKEKLPQMLQSTYNDFEKICTTENLDYLDYHYPEVTEPYKYLPDSFQKWSSIYKAVKKFVPQQDAKDMHRMQKNLNKPGSPSAAGNSQPPIGGSSNRLDEAKKTANWERMQKIIKGV